MLLKKFRIIISLIIISLLTFYFIDFAGLLPKGFNILAKIQLIPAILAVNIIVVVSIFIITLLFGRIYCSSVCPMGTFQDIVNRISGRTLKKRKKFKYKKPKNILRFSILGIIIITFALGFSVLLGLLDPYSSYGRMAVYLIKPIYQTGNNLLESFFSSFENYTFYRVEIIILSLSSFIIAVLTFLVIVIMAWKDGRIYCNTICPVGTLLGSISRFSLFRININNNKCNNCNICSTKCKASCINIKDKKIDHSRCINCFNCLDSCKQDALSFSFNRTSKNKNTEPVSPGRRQFLLSLFASPVIAANLFIEKKQTFFTGKNQIRSTPISPPGSISADHLLHHCTSCHLCISKCPTTVLKPAFFEYGVGGMMQPVMFFEKGFCNYDCTLCSDVCPNNALKRLTVEEKHKTQVGYVVFKEDLCIVHTEGTNCGACAEHCPTQAVTMIPYKDGLTIPYIETDICVGCGGCEFICPVRPKRAISVEGNIVHKETKIIIEEKLEDIKITDFGF